MIADDALPAIAVGILSYNRADEVLRTLDNPIKHPKFHAVLDEVVPALQAIIAGGEIEPQLADADRRIQRVMAR